MTTLRLVGLCPLPLDQSIRDGNLRTLSMKLGICLVLVLNLIDGIFTIVWVETGLGVEANPVLAGLSGDPILFMAVKLLAVSFGAGVFWRYSARPISIFAIVLSNAVYGGVCVYHLHFLTALALSGVRLV